MWPCRAGFHEQGAGRVHAHDADVGILLLQKTAHTADGAPGTHSGDHIGDPAAGLFPDLRPGGQVVAARVLGVVVLVGQDRIGSLVFDRGARRYNTNVGAIRLPPPSESPTTLSRHRQARRSWIFSWLISSGRAKIDL